MTQDGGQERQQGVDVGSLLMPAEQAVDRVAVPKVVDTRAAALAAAFESGAANEFAEGFVHGARTEPGTPDRDEKARRRVVGEPGVSEVRVAVQRVTRRLMQGHPSCGAPFAVAHGKQQRLVVDVRPIQAERFADPHPFSRVNQPVA